MWYQADGPEILQNGLALCIFHHKALDHRAIGLDDDLRLLFSAELHGYGSHFEWLISRNPKPIRRPYSDQLSPDIEYVNWHRKQVFKEPASE